MAVNVDIKGQTGQRPGGAIKVKNIGLRGVTVADTKISHIDGESGILIYRGYRIEDLAVNSGFEETAYLLLHDKLPSDKELEEFRARLVEARSLSGFVFEVLKKLPKESGPMDVLQAAVPLLATIDPELSDESREGNLKKAANLISRTAVMVAAWHRIRQGFDPVPPDENLSHAANFLWMLHGVHPDAETARDLDTCLVLHADHTFNPSTFAAREVVSTRAHMYAGVAAAVGALSGSLHGGANKEVMKMIFELDGEENISAWVRRELDSGRKIMGMGHAVYKTTDPRAKFLKEMCMRLGMKTGQSRWCRILGEVEQAAVLEFERRGKSGIKPNVDFYSAPVYYMMGIPADLMTPVFAVARVAGWTAHIIEEKFGDAQEKPALYRPLSDYIGNYCGKTGCVYVPVDKR